jgi:uncharacterized protein
MSEARNIELLKEYLGALQNSDVEKMASMLAPDATYWISPGTAFSGTHDKASFLALLPGLIEAQSQPINLEYGDITAQDDRVAIVACGHMPLKAGGSYDNVYHWLFTFRNGKIVHVKEFFDALAVLKAFPTQEAKAAA